MDINEIVQRMQVRELHMREYYNEDIDDYCTAFAFIVDFEGKRYTFGEQNPEDWTEGESYAECLLSKENLLWFIAKYLDTHTQSPCPAADVNLLCYRLGIEPYGDRVEDITEEYLSSP